MYAARTTLVACRFCAASRSRAAFRLTITRPRTRPSATTTTWAGAWSRPTTTAAILVPADSHIPAITLFGRRSEEHTSELQSRLHLVCRLLLEKKKKNNIRTVLVILRKIVQKISSEYDTKCT